MLILPALIIVAFVLYVMNTEERARALRPLATGFRYGLWLAGHAAVALRRFARAVRARRPWALTVLGTSSAVVIVLLTHQLTLRTFTDVTPEIERLIAIEDRTARAYDAAVGQFKLGAISSEALVRMIERNVVPELQAVALRLKSLDRVAAEHKSLVARAEEYLQLRRESWRLRAEALQKRNMKTLKKADRLERASLEAFERIRSSIQSPS